MHNYLDIMKAYICIGMYIVHRGIKINDVLTYHNLVKNEQVQYLFDDHNSIDIC